MVHKAAYHSRMKKNPENYKPETNASKITNSSFTSKNMSYI